MALKPIPADFDPSMPIRSAMERYGIAKGTVLRWRKKRGAVPKPQPDAWSERELYLLRTNFNSMTYNQLCELLGRSAASIKSKANSIGLKKASGNFSRDRGPRFDGQGAKGIADMAAQHLRRDGPVYRCDAAGKANPKGKFWRFGNITLTEEQMLAKAERKGWRADSWKQIPDRTVTIGEAANRVVDKLRGTM